MLRVVYSKPETVYRNKELVARLRFLTNGGWGRCYSTMYYIMENRTADHIWIAREAGRVVGWAVIEDKDVDVYVERASRRQGVGRRLTESVVRWAGKRAGKLRCSPGGYLSGISLYNKTPFRIV